MHYITITEHTTFYVDLLVNLFIHRCGKNPYFFKTVEWVEIKVMQRNKGGNKNKRGGKVQKEVGAASSLNGPAL